MSESIPTETPYIFTDSDGPDQPGGAADASTLSDSSPDNAVPIIADAFGEFWKKHPIHQSGLDDETLGKFREFAANIWNNARFDLGLKQIAAMDKLCTIGINPHLHPTLDSCVEAAVRMVTNLRKDLANIEAHGARETK